MQHVTDGARVCLHLHVQVGPYPCTDLKVLDPVKRDIPT